MKITQVRTSLVAVPRSRAVADATATKMGTGGHCFVHVETDEGVEGLGMSTASRAVREVIEHDLKPLLIGADPLHIEGLWQAMFWQVRGFGRKGVAIQALSAVDIALWDLKAKYLGLPLFKLLGPCRESTPIYGSGGWTSFTREELVEEQTGYVERGMRRVKMKVGMDFGSKTRQDLSRLRAVREAVGDDVEIYIDANNGYTAKQAIGLSPRFQEYDVGWLEEPVMADDIDGLARVARAIPIPVATGEHEYTKYGFKDLLVRGAADIAQPDVGRVGGVTEWMKVAQLADAFNIPVASHGYQLVHLHLACATPNMLVVEVLGTVEEADRILYKEFPVPSGPDWAPDPDKLGLGLELNPATVERYGLD
ncbi:MAG: mandelate racemase/muconate lactonizing enzyme family protein [Chloroflexi bacterium]|nr:mandelate racemase/muconate lactonizing enzyme family protein [Chloroflexota bacterium]MCY3937885.1 mandelate racemase/muconate lactonizing enzyme family protein [Chloroflexota bacterium]